ncbi:hypothetical protein RJ640_019869 [Escallonia rubra]|uniref:Uncharacterized protein n=1 Tax=Escallonia rubra TaxID=112253 RepID=A0AA88RIW7_9ASTE|nr:hypothetical protein RJ640_019869 [Escallonia rubra]
MDFQQTQIAKVVGVYPLVLVSNLEKTLLSKLQFFPVCGALRCSPIHLPEKLGQLYLYIVPAYDFFKSTLRSDEKIISALVQAKWTSQEDHTTSDGLSGEEDGEGIRSDCEAPDSSPLQLGEEDYS